jgi:[ribosomal protein S5]-alanine N-acetyltransferase
LALDITVRDATNKTVSQEMIPTLSTAKVTLSPFRLTDAPLVQQYAGHSEIARTTQHIPHPYLDGVAEKWIAAHLLQYLEKTNVVLAVRSHSDELLGAINLGIRVADKMAELGYWISVPFWGQGYCTDAARRMIQYGFEELNLNKIYARHLGGNFASGRVMEKAGMIKEGIQRQHTMKNGILTDIVEYSILRSEYSRG